MAVSKVEYGGRTLIDLTADTVTPETLAEGVTAHGADGEPIVGTMAAGGGGVGEINTGICSVKVTVPASSNYYFAYEKVSSGDVTYQIDRNYTSGTVSKTVRCDSVMYIQASNIKGAEISGGELIRLVSGYGIAYRTPSTAGTTVQITLTA